MKSKEELLKIYSAYLPYELIVRQKFGRYSPTKEDVLEIDDLKTFSMHRIFRPHLYSMDMLTKEIEHKGERFIPAEKLGWVGEVMIGYVNFDMLVVSEYNDLLEWHFNVFGLDESEYIKKEALTLK